jgi:hypothetical protein
MQLQQVVVHHAGLVGTHQLPGRSHSGVSSVASSVSASGRRSPDSAYTRPPSFSSCAHSGRAWLEEILLIRRVEEDQVEALAALGQSRATASASARRT